MKFRIDKIKFSDAKPRICFLAQAALGTGFAYLTGGVFLSGLAILMGAGDLLVSYLSVIVNICGVLILALSAFLNRFPSRKRLAIGLTVLSRAATLFIVAIPAVVPKSLQLLFLIPVIIAAFTLQAQTTVVLNQWMLGFVDEKKSGRYISLRQTLALAVTVAFSVAGGCWMDFMKGEYIGFVLLFAVAALMGVLEVLLLARTPDGAVNRSSHRKQRLRDSILLPLRNRPFIGFVLYILVFYLFLYISDSFTTVYMMKYLRLPYGTVNGLYLLISLPQVALLGVWGRLSDKRGHQFVLKISIWLFSGETLFMSLASAESWFFCIPAAFLIASVANAGFTIAVFNCRYELMPRENRILFDNFYTAAIGLGFIAGPMLGGIAKGLLESAPVLLEVVPLAGIRLLYPISTVGIILLQLVCLTRRRRTRCLRPLQATATRSAVSKRKKKM